MSDLTKRVEGAIASTGTVYIGQTEWETDDEYLKRAIHFLPAGHDLIWEVQGALL